ncbi:type VI secretion system tip protein TssI/VgrG [Novosphingobium sp.]|uniref:type VI secretion system Vgr family protein n=1 Tax=Novosphingobium sp. TaxID=1874826 RepID=UPI0033403547
MSDPHLLNLTALAGEQVDDYALLSFRGREAISEPFDYTIEVITDKQPVLTDWIGKQAEFTVAPGSEQARQFAGRIYGVYGSITDGRLRVEVHIGPAYLALSYARATHFIQDQTSTDIFQAMTAEIPGFTKTVNVSPTPQKRGYVVRYDESELDFLARLLAQDGIFYFFVYDQGGGIYRHRMIVSTKTADYVDVPNNPVQFFANAPFGSITAIERHLRAAPRSHAHMSVNPDKLDTPFLKTGKSALNWGAVYPHDDETIGYEANEEGDLGARQTASDQNLAQASGIYTGTSGEHTLFAGGRLEIADAPALVSGKLVLTSVTHMAYDPWMLHSADTARYSNSFTAIEATQIWRPRVGEPRRVAPGPVVGVIYDGETADGKPKIDDKSRVPVKILGAHEYSNGALPKFVWLPVQQQWAHSTHGAQFFPRIGARVIVDFLYGNPDLPFVSGTVYTPSQPYPFDPRQTPTQSGWRSITEGHGAIKQEFRFEDKDGSEEIYLHTGRDYRREIDQDEWATIKRDQTLTVERDQSDTIKGKVTVDITQTQTVTVDQKSKLESKQEIEFVVGPCSIKLTMSGIEIKAPQIKINADATLDMKAGGQGTLKAPMLEINADGVTIVKGGMVMIN